MEPDIFFHCGSGSPHKRATPTGSGFPTNSFNILIVPWLLQYYIKIKSFSFTFPLLVLGAGDGKSRPFLSKSMGSFLGRKGARQDTLLVDGARHTKQDAIPNFLGFL